MTIEQPTYIYDTQAEAEAASNAMYLEQNPQGTTEMLYGWRINADGKYELSIPVPSTESEDTSGSSNQPSPTLESVQANLLERLSSRQEQAMNAGMPYVFPDGISGIVQTDTTARANINGLVTLALVMQAQGSENPSSFRDASDVQHSMTPSQLIQMGVAVMQFISHTYEVKWAKQTEINALPDLPTAFAYDVNADF